MKTETDERHPSTERGGSLLRRAGSLALAFLNPLSDLMVIYRTGIKPIGVKLRILRDQLDRRRTTNQELLNWEEAVQRSGRSAEQLLCTFRRIRTVWWLVMVFTGALALMLCLMLIAANINLPTGTLIRAAITDLILGSIGALSLAKVLITNVRLWQLSTRRVSVEEGGTFQDYRAENAVWLQVMNPKPSY